MEPREQLASKKSLLEIELNQNLRRRREKLREKIEVVSEVRDVGESTQSGGGGTLPARKVELQSLDGVLGVLNGKINGAIVAA